MTDTHPEMVRIMSIRATPKATVKNKIFEGRKKGKELNFINSENFEILIAELDEIQKMITGLQKSLTNY